MGSRRRANSWSDLPRELLERIADGLGNGLDVSRFRSVCESWRFSVKPFTDPKISLPIKVPCFGSPSHTNDAFLVLSQSTLYHLSDPSSTSSSSSWLVKVREEKGQRQTHVLVNPLSPLPISPLPESFPRTIDPLRFRVSELAKAYAIQLSNGGFCSYKAAFSADEAVVVAVASGVLSGLNLRGREHRWKAVDDVSSQMSYHDVVHYRRTFCAVDERGRTVEVDSLTLKASLIARQVAGGGGGGDKKSLVVSGGDLLLVDAYMKRSKDLELEERFRVYRLNGDEKRWDEVWSLEDRVVFLGEDCSFSVLAGDLGKGFEGNCIIFRDPHFMVFTLADRRVSSLAWRPEYVQLFHPPPSAPEKTQRLARDSSLSCLLFNSLCL